MWYVLFKILSAKVEFLTQFNVTKYGKTGIEYIEQMTYAVGSLMTKSIVVMHSCPTAYVIKQFNRALDFFKNGDAMTNFNAPNLIEIFIECSCHGSLFKTANKVFTSQTL